MAMVILQPRTTPPRPEVEYFLDCAQEAEEMDACSAMTLRLYGDDKAMARVMSYQPDDDGGFPAASAEVPPPRRALHNNPA